MQIRDLEQGLHHIEMLRHSGMYPYSFNSDVLKWMQYFKGTDLYQVNINFIIRVFPENKLKGGRRS
jgi:hypothetical protein